MAVEKQMQELFAWTDKDQDGLLNYVEIKDHAEKMGLFFLQHGVSKDEVLPSDKPDRKLSFEEVQMRFQRGRELRHKEQGLGKLELLRVIAECVEGGSPAYPLESVFSMSHDEIRRWISGPVSEELSKAFILKKDERVAAAELRGRKARRSNFYEKCAMQAVAKFGPMEDYYKVSPPLCPTSFLQSTQNPLLCKDHFLSVFLLLRRCMHSSTLGSDGKDLVIHALCVLYAS